jgi:solute carrier family 41
MGSVVFLARKCHVNPDNIATPVAGTLGDISTLTILAYVSSALFSTLCK